MKLVWYRRDLRTTDHTALTSAITSGESVAAVFVATPGQWHKHHLSPIQADLIFRRLNVVSEELQQLNVPFYLRQTETYADSVDVVVDLAKRLNVNEVLVNIEYELNERRRDQALKQALAGVGITYSEYHDRCLLPPGTVLNRQGDYFKVFTPFKKAWRLVAKAPVINVTPAVVRHKEDRFLSAMSMDTAPKTAMSESTEPKSTEVKSTGPKNSIARSTLANSTLANSTLTNSTLTNSTLTNSTLTNSTLTNSTLANSTLPNSALSTDNILTSGSISSFHYATTSSRFWSVDTGDIQAKLRQFCREKVSAYSECRDYPAVEATSGLSPYLAIGALSVRQCVSALYGESPDGFLSQGAESWLNELIWREFYQHLIAFKPALCRGESFHAWANHLHWPHDEVFFQRWKEGMTGYPIIDAAMRQLQQTGWMHNRLRMIVASFLTKDLHIDWHQGEAYFMSQLIDGDFAANNGGWQWAASTGCDAQPYFRIFNPVTQGVKFDPNGDYVRRWVPELAEVPNRWIHEPWKAPIVKYISYVPPIVDHHTERKVTLSFYQAAKETHDGNHGHVT
jgi:deoxyribodipyrimidine photolyase